MKSKFCTIRIRRFGLPLLLAVAGLGIVALAAFQFASDVRAGPEEFHLPVQGALNTPALEQQQCNKTTSSKTRQSKTRSCEINVAQYGRCFCCNQTGCGCVVVGYCVRAGGYCRGPC